MLRIVVILAFTAPGLLACGGEEAPAPSPDPTTTPAPAEAPPMTPDEEEATPEAPEPTAADAEADGPPDLEALSSDEQEAWLMETGEDVYLTGGSTGVACVTCHQASGEGVPPAFPPLVGQEEHMGSCENHAGIVVHGMTGEIVVDGVTYNGVMPPQGDLTDHEIAAVVTYTRNAWGNDYGICLPEHVQAARENPR